MRQLLFTAAVLLATTNLAAAQSFDTPQALLQSFYAPYLSGDFAEDDSVFRSQALNALYQADEASTPEGEMGALSFDPFVDGQDFELTNLDIRDPAITGDTARVDVTFENFGEPVDLTYELVNEDGWRINDLVSNNPANPYRLSEIFGEGAVE